MTFSELALFLAQIEIVGAFFTIIGCSFFPAGYGRHVNTSWGPLINARLAWIIMESPNLWISLFFVIYAVIHIINISFINGLLLSLFVLHYIHRDLIFPFVTSDSTSKEMPLSVMLMAFSFCCLNGLTQSLNLIFGTQETFENMDFFRKVNFCVGIILFFVGMIINITSDYNIIYQRKNNTTNNHYIIPVGGFFNYVSCANYFGEILEWLGFAFACSSLSGFAFFIFTFSNLVPRALQHHKWYHQKFENYPKNRKAIFPFIL